MRLLYIGKARGDAAVTDVRRRAPKSRAMHAAMVIAVGFALIILAGALLLMLPCAAKSGRATPFIDALFTATSATCVTGLVTVSTAVHWSLFGKCVILLLIQIGGLGFMSVMTAASLLLRRTITLRERMVIGAGFGLDSSGGIVRLMRRVLVGTFLFEGVGAGLLSIRFVQQFGLLRGVGMGVFHAISAFCNGGFDLMGTPDDPFCSLVHYADDPLVNLTIMALIVLACAFLIFSEREFDRLFAPGEEGAPSLDELLMRDLAAESEGPAREDEPVRKGRFGLAIEALAADYQLSPRETDVLRCLAMGYNSSTTASKLSISWNTVRTHTRNVYGKLGVHSQQELIAMVDDVTAAEG